MVDTGRPLNDPVPCMTTFTAFERSADRGSGVVEAVPNLAAYVARGEARPAYQLAFADQLAVFTASGA